MNMKLSDNHRWIPLLRSNSDADSDSRLADALRVSEMDEEAGALLESEQAFNREMGKALNSVTTPPELADRILGQIGAHKKVVPFPKDFGRTLKPLSIAAAILLFFGLAFYPQTGANRTGSLELQAAAALALWNTAQPDPSYSGSDQIQQFLGKHNALQPDQLPNSLSLDHAYACQVVRTAAGVASLICFRKGDTSFHLFTLPNQLAQARSSSMEIHSFSTACCAAWATKSAVYVLISTTGEDSLRELLNY